MTRYILESEDAYGNWKEVDRAITESIALDRARTIAAMCHCDVRITKRTEEFIGIMRAKNK